MSNKVKMFALVPVRVEIDYNSEREISRAHEAVKNMVEFRKIHTDDGIWEQDDAVITLRESSDTIEVITEEQEQEPEDPMRLIHEDIADDIMDKYLSVVTPRAMDIVAQRFQLTIEELMRKIEEEHSPRAAGRPALADAVAEAQVSLLNAVVMKAMIHWSGGDK